MFGRILSEHIELKNLQIDKYWDLPALWLKHMYPVTENESPGWAIQGSPGWNAQEMLCDLQFADQATI